MNKQKLMRYVLMKKEKEMGIELEKEQVEFFNEMEKVYNSDPILKEQINSLVNASSMRDANNILAGNNKKEAFTPYVEDNIKPVDIDNEVSGGGEIAPTQAETSKVLVKTQNRKAGYVDAFVMALVTGFVGGVATTVLFILL
ncbi:MAG: hypothetical protein J6G98_02835 [Bacilli bacterium]|nr:hypothetical protein [Bacilli bacterium]